MKIYRNALYRLCRIVSKSTKGTCPVSIFTKKKGDRLVLATSFTNKAGTTTVVSISHDIIDEAVDTQINIVDIAEIIKGATKFHSGDTVSVKDVQLQEQKKQDKSEWHVKCRIAKAVSGVDGKSVESDAILQEYPCIQQPKNGQVASFGKSIFRHFAEAFSCCDANSVKYALGGVLVDGSQGAIVSTDGRNLYAQSGYQFQHEEKIVFPYLPAAFLEEETKSVESMRFGTVTPFTFYIAYGDIEMNVGALEGRFPRWESIAAIPEENMKIELSESDAQKLLVLIDDLPNGRTEQKDVNKEHKHLYLTGGKKNSVRAYDVETKAGVEVILSGSVSNMPETTFTTCFNRDYLKKALKYGFRIFYIPEEEKTRCYTFEHKEFESGPTFCEDASSNSRYVFMGLSTFSEPQRFKIQRINTGKQTVAIGNVSRPAPVLASESEKKAGKAIKKPATQATAKEKTGVFEMSHVIVLRKEKILVAVMKHGSCQVEGQTFDQYYTQINHVLSTQADWQISRDGKTICHNGQKIEAELVEKVDIHKVTLTIKKDLYSSFVEVAKKKKSAPNQYLLSLIENVVRSQ